MVEFNFVINIIVLEVVCGVGGLIGVNLVGGVGFYQISWMGLEFGNQMVVGFLIIIGDLFVGIYIIYVVDVNGCLVIIIE